MSKNAVYFQKPLGFRPSPPQHLLIFDFVDLKLHDLFKLWFLNWFWWIEL